METEILSYVDMCKREATSLQRGMNFGLGGDHSVLLMSVRTGAPYRDRLEDNGATLIYEGHDEPKTQSITDPKMLDQSEYTSSGGLTQNGMFQKAAQKYKEKLRPAECVRVYEKIRPGIWSYNGVFLLVDSWRESDSARMVFKFRLEAVEGIEESKPSKYLNRVSRRVIPTQVKLEVWKRDGGKCVVCGATNELHFDHDLPYSRGGTSISVDNVQILCARHNLEKSNHIV